MAELAEPLRLVLVDDDPVSLGLLRELFRQDEGFEVVLEATDGREAVERLDELSPDAVVLDLKMPDVSGMEALPVMRDAAPAAAIVVYSALSADELTRVDKSGDADAVVSKAAPPSTLRDRIVHAVERRQG